VADSSFSRHRRWDHNLHVVAVLEEKHVLRRN
jgi:hypothetical protein